jgi:hypothetical protein
MFETMPTLQRVEIAKEKTRRAVDHVHYLLELHENNAIVLYTDALANQIPTSFAANAFNVFRQGLHQIEIVRLCALWDGPDLDKENVPTVIELIEIHDVIEALAEATAAHWRGTTAAILNPSSDPELQRLELEALQRSNEQYPIKQFTMPSYSRSCTLPHLG